MLWWVAGNALLCIALGMTVLVIDALVRRVLARARRAHLQRYLRAYPEDGDLQVDGSYRYARGRLTLHYLYHPDAPAAQERLVWLSIRQRLTAWERLVKTLLRRLRLLASRDGVLQLLYARTGGLLALTLLLGVGLTTSPAVRAQRLEWLIAQALGLNPERVEVHPGGWVTLDGTRQTVIDRAQEPVQATINPINWLLGRPHGYVLRYRGELYGYVSHPVSLTNRADVWLHKEGLWRHGQLRGRQLIWSRPEGTGVREGFVRQQELPTVTDLPIPRE